MLLDIYKDSFEYGFKNVYTLLKLGLLSLFSFLLIPAFLVLGYNYRIVKVATAGMINGDDPLPEMNEWTSMLVDGVKYFIVVAIYFIIPLVILFASFYFSSYNPILFPIGVLITLILIFIACLFIIIAIPNMTEHNDSIKAAFDFKEIVNIFKSVGTLRYIGFYIGLSIIMFAITLMVSLILIVILSILGFATLYALPTQGLLIGSVMGIIIQAILALFVAPYLSIFEHRCEGLIFNIRE